MLVVPRRQAKHKQESHSVAPEISIVKLISKLFPVTPSNTTSVSAKISKSSNRTGWYSFSISSTTSILSYLPRPDPNLWRLRGVSSSHRTNGIKPSPDILKSRSMPRSPSVPIVEQSFWSKKMLSVQLICACDSGKTAHFSTRLSNNDTQACKETQSKTSLSQDETALHRIRPLAETPSTPCANKSPRNSIRRLRF